MTPSSRHLTSNNLEILKNLIELKKLGLNSQIQNDELILSIKIKEQFHLVKDIDFNIAIEKLITKILNN